MKGVIIAAVLLVVPNVAFAHGDNPVTETQKASVVAKQVAQTVKSKVKLEAVSHSGGTDANGCHTNRKTGVYHCH